MKAHEPLHSNSKTARLAALLFFTVCVPLVTWGLSYVPSNIFVCQDATATANNLVSNEFLFRTGIVSHLVHQHHPARALHDLIIRAVIGRRHGRPDIVGHQAAFL